MDDVIDDRIERLQRQERRRNRLAARRRNWYGWGNLHSISATAGKKPFTRPMTRQYWKINHIAPVLFAAPLLVLLIVLFASLWPRTHRAAVCPPGGHGAAAKPAGRGSRGAASQEDHPAAAGHRPAPG